MRKLPALLDRYLHYANLVSEAFSGTPCTKVSWFAVTPDVRYLVYISQVRYKIQTSLVAQMVKHLPSRQETWVWLLGQEDPLEKAMAPHSSTLAWKIPWTEEPGGLQSKESQRVRHDWVTSLSLSLTKNNYKKVFITCYKAFPKSVCK